ncbi:Ricin-type beta-trefoil lectin domain protein [Streptomyces sp. YIM 130001]|uniref:RICIN domain-containing protein n=1 Tax=Streptomyces sp. YIM 130001 TaxID=2259644 RepID=UPI000E650F11|nr:RICIN domain-containing protein [Streptomyces sp. YIM 130001]RII18466.1 Ricin-type beta-trefoil lectin domain protein [Streptomyces sp. YIM 130001]
MTLDRRRFLNTGALAVGSTTLLASFGSPAAAVPRAAGDRAAPTARDEATRLAPTAFGKLPLGSVAAKGWLAGQLDLLLKGLFGRYAEISDYLDIDSSGWAHPENDGWEELTYWLRGYVDLAALTGDADAQAAARRWIDAIIATRQDDGFFGPTVLRTALNDGPDFWPYLPLMQALRSHEEFTGDERIVPMLLSFLRFMNEQGPSAFDSSWVSKRWGDGLDIVFWLHGRTEEAFLLELADKMHEHGANWVDNFPDLHNVNVAQGFREPAQYALRAGGTGLTRSTYRNYETIIGRYGQFPGGGFAGDENARPGFDDPRQGFETCGTVEFMASHELLTRITGDPVWADRCEDLAFNLLPAATDPQGRGLHYVTSANSVDLDDAVKTEGQFQNGFAMQSFKPGVRQYRCCPHNYGMGWPYFTEELWLSTPDHGLAAAMYAPCEVRAEVGADSTEITVTEETDYPFKDTVTLTVHTARDVDFPLLLRVPGWCSDPRITVGGKQVEAGAGPRFVRVERTWRDGDRVTVQLPQRVAVRTWEKQHGAVSIDRGPLTYSLRIGEEYERTGGTDTFPELAVHAGTAWNYGLDPEPLKGLRVDERPGPVEGDPFTHDGAPVTITAKARRIEEWVADAEHVVAPLQESPARGAAEAETVTLIPMGAARLRLTAFPTATPDGRRWTPEPPYRRILNRHSDKVLAVDEMSLDDGGRVVQFDNAGTSDHAWQLVDQGSGWYLIRNGYSGKVLAVDGASTANGAPAVQATDDGSDDHLWQLVDSGDGWYRIRNRHSEKVLGVDEMSTANSAQVVQYEDNGTDDHLWKLV